MEKLVNLQILCLVGTVLCPLVVHFSKWLNFKKEEAWGNLGDFQKELKKFQEEHFLGNLEFVNSFFPIMLFAEIGSCIASCHFWLFNPPFYLPFSVTLYFLTYCTARYYLLGWAKKKVNVTNQNL